MSLAQNDVINERTKHIDVKYHFIKEMVNNGTVNLQYISTQEMTADIMTKNLQAVKHKTFAWNESRINGSRQSRD